MSGRGTIDTGRPPIEDLLADLIADDLRTLALLLVDADPKMVDVVNVFCSQTKD